MTHLLRRYFPRLFAKQSTDTITNGLQKIVTELATHIDQQADSVTEITTRIDSLTKDLQDTMNEKSKAIRVRDRVKSLLED